MTTPIPSDTMRLDKRVAELRGCSRADAQAYIEGGWVTVDGVVVERCQTQVLAERIVVDVEASLDAVEAATLLLHKPERLPLEHAATQVTLAMRAPDDASGVRPVARHLQRLTPLMPLDDDASGLVVLSQDGRVWRRLTEDYASIEQEFVVEVSGEIIPYGLAKLAVGLRYRGRILQPAKVSWQNEVRLRFAIKDVQPGQLRHMCAEVGLRVVSIRRIRIGRIGLNRMPVGQWRYVPAGERF